jgi:hypothetical protein
MSFIQSNLGSITSLYGYAFDATSQTLAAIIQQRENARLKQIKHFWNYYHGRHYDYSRVDGDLPYINMCYGMVEKSVSWLVGKSPQFRFRQDIHPIIHELAQEVLDNSGGNSLWYKAAQSGSVTGDCFLQVAFEPLANYGQGGIVIKVLDSDRTFVEYTNQGNSKILSKVMISWDEIDQNTGEVATFTEVWTPDAIYVFPKNISLSIRSLSAAFKNSDIKETSNFTMFPNPYGELPFVHIPNLVLADNVYGRSDLHDMWVLNKEMNESLVAYKDNVNYHGNPLTLLYGISLKQIEKGANKVWGNLPKDGRVENLRVESLYSDITQYMQLLEKYTGLSNPPLHLMNLEQSMFADTSQAGLRLAFLPLVELTERKQVPYGKGFKEAMEKAIKYTNTFFQLNLESLNRADDRVRSKLQSKSNITIFVR